MKLTMTSRCNCGRCAICASADWSSDGQVQELLAALAAAGYQGVLALEPHLAIAGRSGGFSGVEGMTIAVKALRKLMSETGCQEIV
jgi:hypothetical protein